MLLLRVLLGHGRSTVRSWEEYCQVMGGGVMSRREKSTVRSWGAMSRREKSNVRSWGE